MKDRKTKMSEPDPLESRLLRKLSAGGLFIPGDRLVVGVSGGADSMGLLSMVCALRKDRDVEVFAWYGHHGLRAAADEEEKFVRHWAERLHCRFATNKLPVRAFQRESKASLLEAARECRYRALETQLEFHDARAGLVAHTADDQAEEVLVGLVRGAGLGGLCGIPERRGRIFRPLLDTYRSEILAYLSRRGIPWLEDASNRDLRYLRSRIRHRLIPELKTYSPNIVRQLNRMAGLLQADEALLQEKTERAWRRLASGAGEIEFLERQGLGRLPQALGARLIQKALQDTPGGLKGIGSRHILEMINQLAGPATRGQMDLPGNRIAVWEARRFFIRPTSACPQPAEPFLYRLVRPGTVSIRETGGLLQVKKVRLSSRNWVQGVPSGRAVVDWDKIRWPLIIRSLQPGDRFRPLGLEGTKKVSRFFQDRKVPRTDRSRLPLIWSGGDLVWIAGMEVGQPFALEEGSRLGLQLTYRPSEEKVFETNHR